MTRTSKRLPWAVLVLLTTNSALAQGGESVTAEALFQEGRALLEQGKAEEACPKLAESQRLDPATGTLIALALCHEQQGKLASAWAEFTEAEGRARADKRKDRVALAHKHAGALKPRLSTLTIQVSQAVAATAGLRIVRDGVELGEGTWNTPVPIDGGEHAIEASAPGKEARKWSVAVKPEADQAATTVEPLADALAEKAPPQPVEPVASKTPVKPESSAFGTLQWAGIGTAGAGVVALGVGGFFLAGALSKKSDSKDDCSGNVCGPSGQQARSDAVDRGNMATVFGIAGGALIAGGAALFFLGKDKSAEQRPDKLSFDFGVAPGAANARVSGAF